MAQDADDFVVIGELNPAPAADGVLSIDEAAGDSPLPKNAVLQDDGSVILKLLVPASLKWKPAGGGDPRVDEYTQLHMHRLLGSDMKALQEAARADVAMVAIARSVKIPSFRFRHIFERMDGADIQAASGVVSHFLSNGPTTGR